MKKKAKKKKTTKKKGSKKKKLVIEIEKIKESGLTLQQEKFCEFYSSDREFFGNGVQAYIEAYDINLSKKGAYESAKQCAYKLLTNVDILARINELLELRGLNDAFVDKQLELVITQNADFHAKVASIREYNKLKKRTVEKLEIISKRPFEAMTNEELAEYISNAKKFLLKK